MSRILGECEKAVGGMGRDLAADRSLALSLLSLLQNRTQESWTFWKDGRSQARSHLLLSYDEGMSTVAVRVGRRMDLWMANGRIVPRMIFVRGGQVRAEKIPAFHRAIRK